MTSPSAAKTMKQIKSVNNVGEKKKTNKPQEVDLLTQGEVRGKKKKDPRQSSRLDKMLKAPSGDDASGYFLTSPGSLKDSIRGRGKQEGSRSPREGERRRHTL